MTDQQPCSFCGSHACEWDGPLLLGCEDCGYEVGDPATDPEPYALAARELFGPPEPVSFSLSDGPYDLSDPKHPKHHDVYSELADA